MGMRRHERGHPDRRRVVFWLAAWAFNEWLVRLEPRSALGAGRSISSCRCCSASRCWCSGKGSSRGFNVPTVLLPPPSPIWARIVASLPTLWADFHQTFLKAVLIGYALGCGAGFLVAIAIDRSPFLSAACCRSAISSRRCRSSASRRSW